MEETLETIRIRHESTRVIKAYTRLPKFIKQIKLTFGINIVKLLITVFDSMKIVLNKRFLNCSTMHPTSINEKIQYIDTFYQIKRYPEKFDALYAKLEDEKSKDVFNWYIQTYTAYPILNIRTFNMFPPPTSKIQANPPITKEEFYKHGFMYDEIFPLLRGQYRLDSICQVEKGDIILDLGGYIGETLYYFSKQTGPSGEVHVFEPVPSSMDSIKQLSKQSYIEPKTTLVPYGAWDVNDSISITCAEGQSTALRTGKNSNFNTITIKTLPIDDYVFDNELKSVDFIKMDIEGAEQKALKGAARTMSEFKPKLAISVYHMPTDLYGIPEIILQANPNYRFYLRHYTTGLFETILYAV